MTKIDVHRDNVETWRDVSAIAHGNGDPTLTDEQRDAYLLLPDLLDTCASSYESIPAYDPLRFLRIASPRSHSYRRITCYRLLRCTLVEL